MLSENMTPEHWVIMGREIERLIEEEDPDGIPICMAPTRCPFTSTALSFMLARLRGPGGVDWSNRPPNEPDTDADTNIADALIRFSISRRGLSLLCRPAERKEPGARRGVSVRKARGSGRLHLGGKGPRCRGQLGTFSWTLKSRTNRTRSPRSRFFPDRRRRPRDENRSTRDQSESMADMLIRDGFRGGDDPLPGSDRPFEPERSRCRGLPIGLPGTGSCSALTMNAQPVGVQNSYESKLLLEETGAVLLPVIPELALVKLDVGSAGAVTRTRFARSSPKRSGNEFGGRSSQSRAGSGLPGPPS